MAYDFSKGLKRYGKIGSVERGDGLSGIKSGPNSPFVPRKNPHLLAEYFESESTGGDSSRLLDASRFGTSRTGEEGRCYTADGTDDEVIYGDIGTAIWFSGWVKLNSDNQCLFSLSNDTNTNVIVSAGVLTAGATLTLIGIKVDNVSKTASEAGVLLNDNLWHFLSCGIGDGLGGGSTADDVRFFTDGTNHGSVSGFDWRFYSTTPTSDELTEAYSGTGARNIAAMSKYALWAKCDEQSGTTSYDSSGNGNNGTITNDTLANFHATQDIYSFQNQVGYNLSGAVYIPRDESDPTNDVLGNPLTYTGVRPNDGALINSSCLTADGSLYIAAAHLVGTETVVRSGGTSTPSISAGRIDFTAGTCWDLLLSDGTYYPLSNCNGIGISDASGNENHGILTSAILANAWGATQSEFNYNLLNGHNLCYQPAIQVYSGANAATIVSLSFKWRSTDTSLVIFNDGALDPWLIVPESGSSSTQIFRDSGTPVLHIDGSSAWGTTRDDLYNTLCDGEAHDVVVSNLDMTVSAQWAANGVYLNSYSVTNWDSTTYLWDLVALNSSGDVVPLANDPNVRLPAVTPTTGPYGITLNNPSGNYHNNAETEINFNPDSTPEMGGQLGSYTAPAAHAFGDDMDSGATDQGFARQTPSKEDRFAIFAEPQTGAALTTIENWTA